MNRREFLRKAGRLTAGMMAAGAVGIPTALGEDSPVYTPGVYTASAEGHGGGLVRVRVTFDEKSITGIEVDASDQTEAVGGPAAKILEQQIMAAQSSAIDGVTGATLTSRAVKNAVADCIRQASGGRIVEGGDVAVTDEEAIELGAADWLGEAPSIDEAEIAETIDTQILIVGAGNAGLIAAAKASSAGEQVLVIDKGVSSTTERHWIGALGTAEAIACGAKADKNLTVAELCRYASHRCDERLIRLWADRSGEVVDWLYSLVQQHHPDVELHMEWDIGKGGHDTFYVPATMHNFQDQLPEHDYSSGTAEYGFDSMIKTIQANGGEIRYQTALVKLEQNAAGRVTGIIATNAEGRYIRINAAKGVLLACGGYAANKAMLAAINPDAYISTVNNSYCTLDTGDGIKAAMWIGADKDPDGTAMLFDRGGIRPDQTVMSANWDETGYFHLGSQPWLKVNMRGERFANESQPYDFILHAAFMQPGHVYSTIYDSDWMRHVAQFHQIGCARIAPSDSGGKLQIFSPELEARILGMLEARGFVQRADTLEELAAKLQLPVEPFVATVKRYNELCEKGVDEDFGKEAYRMIPLKTAPFFGCRQGASLLCTLDGLRINEKMQVLDKEGEPIDGLYAAGDCSGSFFAHNYPEYVVGVAVGRSLTEGYVAGEALASM